MASGAPIIHIIGRFPERRLGSAAPGLLVARAVLARNRAWAAVAVPQDAGVLSDRTQLSMGAIPGPATLVGAASSECWNEVTVIAFLTRGPRVLPLEMLHTGVSDID